MNSEDKEILTIKIDENMNEIYQCERSNGENSNEDPDEEAIWNENDLESDVVEPNMEIPIETFNGEPLATDKSYTSMEKMDNPDLNTAKEVCWPPRSTATVIPKDEVDKNSIVMRNLPNRAATVHMGKERRKKIDDELKKFKGAPETFSSHPFGTGGFKPNKFDANEKWN